MRRSLASLALLGLAAALALHVWALVDARNGPITLAVAGAEEVHLPAQDQQPGPLGLPSEPPVLAYQTLAERPLFTPSRRPPDPEPVGATPAEVAASQEVAVDFALEGVIIGQVTLVAIVRVDGDKIQQRLKIGDEVQGWKLVAVKEAGATFQRGNLKHEIELNFNKPAEPAPAPRAPATGGAAMSLPPKK